MTRAKLADELGAWMEQKRRRDPVQMLFMAGGITLTYIFGRDFIDGFEMSPLVTSAILAAIGCAIGLVAYAIYRQISGRA